MALHSYGTNVVDWEQRADMDRLRRERLARAKAHLERSEIGALLCFDMANIRYITATHIGTWAMDKLIRFCLLTRDHEPIMWDFGSAARHHKIYSPWLGEERSRAGISTLRGAVEGRAESVGFGWVTLEAAEAGIATVGRDPSAGERERRAAILGPGAHGGTATAAHRPQEGPLGPNGPMGRTVVEGPRGKLGRASTVTDLDGDRALARRRRHLARVEDLADPVAPPQALQPGDGQDEGVRLAPIEAGQPAVHVAVEGMGGQVGPKPTKEPAPARAVGAHAGAHREGR